MHTNVSDLQPNYGKLMRNCMHLNSFCDVCWFSNSLMLYICFTILINYFNSSLTVSNAQYLILYQLKAAVAQSSDQYIVRCNVTLSILGSVNNCIAMYWKTALHWIFIQTWLKSLEFIFVSTRKIELVLLDVFFFNEWKWTELKNHWTITVLCSSSNFVHSLLYLLCDDLYSKSLIYLLNSFMGYLCIFNLSKSVSKL